MQDKLVKLEKKYGVDWREFNLEELFGKSTRGRRLKSQDRIAGALPFVTAGEADTGISAYIGNDVQIFAPNTITIDMFGSAKYRGYHYGADDHVAVVHTEKLGKKAAQYVTAAIHKASHAGQFDYSRNFYATDADELVIQLPTQNGEIAYEFMNEFVETLEAERLATLEAYLKATGLNNVALSAEERSSLDKLGGAGSVEWKVFEVSELFEFKHYGTQVSIDKFDRNGVATINYVMQNENDNGIVDKVPVQEDPKFRMAEGNSLSAFTHLNKVYYQEQPFYSKQGSNVYTLRAGFLNKYTGLFFAACINSQIKVVDYGKNTASRMEKRPISVPVDIDGKPDFEFMTILIKAMQKVVIKGVVEWVDKRIEVTKGVMK